MREVPLYHLHNTRFDLVKLVRGSWQPPREGVKGLSILFFYITLKPRVE